MQLTDFKIRGALGEGSFGKVYLVELNDKKMPYAMKVLEKQLVVDRNQVKNTNTERTVAGNVKSRYISTLRYAFQDKARLYLVSDYYAGRELFYRIRSEGCLHEEHAKFYAAEMVLAIDSLHKMGVVYRDLKPENVMVNSDGHIKLIDFGLCKNLEVIELNRTESISGTPEYLAPEIIPVTRRCDNPGYSYAVDWWTLGCTLYEMLNGCVPFYAPKDAEGKIIKDTLYDNIRSGKVTFRKRVSPNARELISKLLVKDEAARLTKVEKIKKMPFFKGIDWKTLEKGDVPAPWLPEIDSIKAAELDHVEPCIDPRAKFPNWDYDYTKLSKGLESDA